MLASAVALSSACARYPVAKYVALAAGSPAALAGRRVKVEAFIATTPGESTRACRLSGSVQTPDGAPFEEFIRAAFIDEFVAAGALISDQAPITLMGTLENIDFATIMGRWTFAATLTSSNGRRLSLAEKYPYDPGMIGEDPCARTAAAFLPAVQRFIGTFLRHPDFAELLE
jgi:hypothetical protein